MRNLKILFICWFVPVLAKSMEHFTAGACKNGTYDVIYDDISYNKCVRKCRAKRSCLAVSYHSKANICKLHTNFGNILQQNRCPGYVFSEKANWQHKEIPACSTNVCKELETCLEDDAGIAQCVYQECEPVATILYGKIYGSENRKVGSKILYKCDVQINGVNNDVIRTCEETGQWDGVTPTCPTPECPVLQNIAHGTINGIEHRTIGSTVTYVCVASYRIKLGDNQRTCLENQTWSGTQPSCLQYEFTLPQRSGHPNYQEFDMFANGISFVDKDLLVFKVKAGNDVHIALQIYRNGWASTQTIEIILGGWGNSQSAIRQGINGSPFHSQYSENGIVTNGEYRDFWIKSTSSCIEVGKGAGPYYSPIMNYCGVTSKHQYLSIGVGYNSGASFIFP